MRLRYPTAQNDVLNREDANHNVIPGAWRQDAQLGDMQEARRGNIDTWLARQQRKELKHYYRSVVGAVPWQDGMI